MPFHDLRSFTFFSIIFETKKLMKQINDEYYCSCSGNGSGCCNRSKKRNVKNNKMELELYFYSLLTKCATYKSVTKHRKWKIVKNTAKKILHSCKKRKKRLYQKLCLKTIENEITDEIFKCVSISSYDLPWDILYVIGVVVNDFNSNVYNERKSRMTNFINAYESEVEDEKHEEANALLVDGQYQSNGGLLCFAIVFITFIF